MLLWQLNLPPAAPPEPVTPPPTYGDAAGGSTVYAEGITPARGEGHPSIGASAARGIAAIAESLTPSQGYAVVAEGLTPPSGGGNPAEGVTLSRGGGNPAIMVTQDAYQCELIAWAVPFCSRLICDNSTTDGVILTGVDITQQSLWANKIDAFPFAVNVQGVDFRIDTPTSPNPPFTPLPLESYKVFVAKFVQPGVSPDITLTGGYSQLASLAVTPHARNYVAFTTPYTIPADTPFVVGVIPTRGDHKFIYDDTPVTGKSFYSAAGLDYDSNNVNDGIEWVGGGGLRRIVDVFNNPGGVLWINPTVCSVDQTREDRLIVRNTCSVEADAEVGGTSEIKQWDPISISGKTWTEIQVTGGTGNLGIDRLTVSWDVGVGTLLGDPDNVEIWAVPGVKPLPDLTRAVTLETYFGAEQLLTVSTPTTGEYIQSFDLQASRYGGNTFTIYLFGKTAAGLKSAVRGEVMDMIPPIPQNVTMRSVSTERLDIGWDSPLGLGAYLDGYRVVRSINPGVSVPAIQTIELTSEVITVSTFVDASGAPNRRPVSEVAPPQSNPYDYIVHSVSAMPNMTTQTRFATSEQTLVATATKEIP